MRVVYTEKGEREGLGKAGAPVVDDGTGDQIRYALTHGYGIESADPPMDASLRKPPVDSAVRKGKK